MVDDPRSRNGLEAVAFGRVVTPEDEAAAARALQALRELDERSSASRARVADILAVPVPVPGGGGARNAAATGVGAASGPIMVEVVDDSAAMSYGTRGGAPSRVTEVLHRFWVIPVVIASVALGAVGGSMATRAAEKPAASLASVAQASPSSDSGSGGGPSDTPVVPDPAGLVDSLTAAASLASATEMLNQPQRQADTYPDTESLKGFGIDPTSTHFMTTEGTTSLWIARGDNRSLCLVMKMKASESSGCAPEEQFAAAGLWIASDGTSAHWDGNGVTLAPDLGSAGG